VNEVSQEVTVHALHVFIIPTLPPTVGIEQATAQEKPSNQPGHSGCVGAVAGQRSPVLLALPPQRSAVQASAQLSPTGREHGTDPQVVSEAEEMRTKALLRQWNNKVMPPGRKTSL
jgi:hypothetical protein